MNVLLWILQVALAVLSAAVGVQLRRHRAKFPAVLRCRSRAAGGERSSVRGDVACAVLLVVPAAAKADAYIRGSAGSLPPR